MITFALYAILILKIGRLIFLRPCISPARFKLRVHTPLCPVSIAMVQAPCAPQISWLSSFWFRTSSPPKATQRRRRMTATALRSRSIRGGGICLPTLRWKNSGTGGLEGCADPESWRWFETHVKAEHVVSLDTRSCHQWCQAVQVQPVRYQHVRLARTGALDSWRAMSPGQGREEGFCEELGDGAVGTAKSTSLTESPWLSHSLSPRGDP